MQAIHFTRQSISLEGADVGQEASRKPLWPADRIFPWSEIVQLLNPDRGLDPVDGLGVSHKVDVRVLLEQGIHPVLEGVDVTTILIQPAKNQNLRYL